MIRRDREALSLQFAIERLESMRRELTWWPGIKDDVRQDLDIQLGWIIGECERARNGGEDHRSSGGLKCGCHDPFGRGQGCGRSMPRPDCPACHGMGTVPIEEIAARAWSER